MNRSQLENVLKRDGLAVVSLTDARMIWTNRTQFKVWCKDFGVARYMDEGNQIRIQHSSIGNPDCQKCDHVPGVCLPGEVRMLVALDGASFEWLCLRCFEAEVKFRFDQGYYRKLNKFIPTWEKAKVKPEDPVIQPAK